MLAWRGNVRRKSEGIVPESPCASPTRVANPSGQPPDPALPLAPNPHLQPPTAADGEGPQSPPSPMLISLLRSTSSAAPPQPLASSSSSSPPSQPPAPPPSSSQAAASPARLLSAHLHFDDGIGAPIASTPPLDEGTSPTRQEVALTTHASPRPAPQGAAELQRLITQRLTIPSEREAYLKRYQSRDDYPVRLQATISAFLSTGTYTPYAVGDMVEVHARFLPGDNKAGGRGKIQKVHADHYYDVKYVVDGVEKRVDGNFIFRVSMEVSKSRTAHCRCPGCGAFLHECLCQDLAPQRRPRAQPQPLEELPKTKKKRREPLRPSRHKGASGSPEGEGGGRGQGAEGGGTKVFQARSPSSCGSPRVDFPMHREPTHMRKRRTILAEDDEESETSSDDEEDDKRGGGVVGSPESLTTGSHSEDAIPVTDSPLSSSEQQLVRGELADPAHAPSSSLPSIGCRDDFIRGEGKKDADFLETVTKQRLKEWGLLKLGRAAMDREVDGVFIKLFCELEVYEADVNKKMEELKAILSRIKDDSPVEAVREAISSLEKGDNWLVGRRTLFARIGADVLQQCVRRTSARKRELLNLRETEFLDKYNGIDRAVKDFEKELKEETAALASFADGMTLRGLQYDEESEGEDQEIEYEGRSEVSSSPRGYESHADLRQRIRGRRRQERRSRKSCGRQDPDQMRFSSEDEEDLEDAALRGRDNVVEGAKHRRKRRRSSTACRIPQSSRREAQGPGERASSIEASSRGPIERVDELSDDQNSGGEEGIDVELSSALPVRGERRHRTSQDSSERIGLAGFFPQRQEEPEDEEKAWSGLPSARSLDVHDDFKERPEDASGFGASEGSVFEPDDDLVGFAEDTEMRLESLMAVCEQDPRCLGLISKNLSHVSYEEGKLRSMADNLLWNLPRLDRRLSETAAKCLLYWHALECFQTLSCQGLTPVQSRAAALYITQNLLWSHLNNRWRSSLPRELRPSVDSSVPELCPISRAWLQLLRTRRSDFWSLVYDAILYYPSQGDAVEEIQKRLTLDQDIASGGSQANGFKSIRKDKEQTEAWWRLLSRLIRLEALAITLDVKDGICVTARERARGWKVVDGLIDSSPLLVDVEPSKRHGESGLWWLQLEEGDSADEHILWLLQRLQAICDVWPCDPQVLWKVWKATIRASSRRLCREVPVLLDIAEEKKRARLWADWIRQAIATGQLCTTNAPAWAKEDQGFFQHLMGSNASAFDPTFLLPPPNEYCALKNPRRLRQMAMEGRDQILLAASWLLGRLLQYPGKFGEHLNWLKQNLHTEMERNTASFGVVSAYSLTLATLELVQGGELHDKLLVNYWRTLKLATAKQEQQEVCALLSLQFLAYLPVFTQQLPDFLNFNHVLGALQEWIETFCLVPPQEGSIYPSVPLSSARQQWGAMVALSKMFIIHARFPVLLSQRVGLWTLIGRLLLRYHREIKDGLCSILLWGLNGCLPRPPRAQAQASPLATIPWIRQADMALPSVFGPLQHPLTLEDWREALGACPLGDLLMVLNTLSAQVGWSQSLQQHEVVTHQGGEAGWRSHRVAVAEAMGVAWALRHLQNPHAAAPNLLNSCMNATNASWDSVSLATLRFFAPVFYCRYFLYASKHGDSSKDWDILGLCLDLCMDMATMKKPTTETGSPEGYVFEHLLMLVDQALQWLRQSQDLDLQRIIDFTTLLEDLQLQAIAGSWCDLQDLRNLSSRMIVVAGFCLSVAYLGTKGKSDGFHKKVQGCLRRLVRSLRLSGSYMMSTHPDNRHGLLQVQLVYRFAGLFLRLVGPILQEDVLDDLIFTLFPALFGHKGCRWNNSCRAHLESARFVGDVLRCCVRTQYGRKSWGRGLRHLVREILFCEGTEGRPDKESLRLLYQAVVQGLWCCSCSPEKPPAAFSPTDKGLADACRHVALLSNAQSPRIQAIEAKMRERLDRFRAQFWYDMNLMAALRRTSNVARQVKYFLYVAFTNRCACPSSRAPPACLNNDLFPFIKPLTLSLWHSLLTSDHGSFTDSLRVVNAMLECPTRVGQTSDSASTLIALVSRSTEDSMASSARDLDSSLHATACAWFDLVATLSGVMLELIASRAPAWELAVSLGQALDATNDTSSRLRAASPHTRAHRFAWEKEGFFTGHHTSAWPIPWAQDLSRWRSASDRPPTQPLMASQLVPLKKMKALLEEAVRVVEGASTVISRRRHLLDQIMGPRLEQLSATGSAASV